MAFDDSTNGKQTRLEGLLASISEVVSDLESRSANIQSSAYRLNERQPEPESRPDPHMEPKEGPATVVRKLCGILDRLNDLRDTLNRIGNHLEDTI